MDSEIEERQLPRAMADFESYPDGPDILQFQRSAAPRPSAACTLGKHLPCYSHRARYPTYLAQIPWPANLCEHEATYLNQDYL
jgi:hypothetical protein